MKAFIKLCFFLTVTVLLLSACAGLGGQSAKKIDYYTLEYDFPIQAQGLHQLPYALRIKRFQVSPIYNSIKIIYRETPFTRNEYYYHKWRANPGDMVTFFLARDLQESSLFKVVFCQDKTYSSDYVLTGSVEDFFEHDGKNSWEAVLSIRIVLIKENEPDISRRVVFQKRYHQRSKCKQKNPESFAEAMSLSLAEISNQLANDVYRELAKVKN